MIGYGCLISVPNVVLNHLRTMDMSAACEQASRTFTPEYDKTTDYVAITEWNEQFTTLSAESVE